MRCAIQLSGRRSVLLVGYLYPLLTKYTVTLVWASEDCHVLHTLNADNYSTPGKVKAMRLWRSPSPSCVTVCHTQNMQNQTASPWIPAWRCPSQPLPKTDVLPPWDASMQRPQLVWLVALHLFGSALGMLLQSVSLQSLLSFVGSFVVPFQRLELSSLQSLGHTFVGRLPLPQSPSSLSFAALGTTNLYFRHLRRRCRLT